MARPRGVRRRVLLIAVTLTLGCAAPTRGQTRDVSADSVLAVAVIPADTSSWTAVVHRALDGEPAGRVYGRSGATRTEWDDGSRRIHDPVTGEVLLFDAVSEYGTIESEWRLPWLLAEDVLRDLDVRVVSSGPQNIAGQDVVCRELDGRGDYGEWLAGTVCTTPDGIHMSVELEGEHPLEGGDDVMPWSAAYRFSALERGPQPDELFQRPAHVTAWVAPG